MKSYGIKLEEAWMMIRHMLSVVAIWVLSTMMAIVLNHMQVRTENLLLIYVVGVVICSVETRSMWWGIGSSVLFVFTFNFLFTDPKYTFRMDDPNYVISWIIFIVVAFIVASLTVKLQRQMDIANLRIKVTANLNAIGSGFLNLSGIPAVERYSRESLKTLTGKSVDIMIRNGKHKEFVDSMAEWCYRNSMPCGHGESQFGDSTGLYVPIRNSNRTYGVILFDCSDGDLEEEERVYVDTVVSQITLVLEREKFYVEKEETKLQIEKERLKSTLLRSISHDLRTPLTGIAGNSDFLKEHYGLIENQEAQSILEDICNDAQWLNSMVENLLNMTRIQEGRLELQRKKEVVDDLILGAAELVSKRLGTHELYTETPEEILLVPVDGSLFTQVLVNLLDNAIRHSGEKTHIRVKAVANVGTVSFYVEDDGIGVCGERQQQIFDNFFTTAYEQGDKKRGTGLGLSICKAIVEAHNGTISVYNNETGGATFRIDLPLEEEYS